jgi:hypothetical protein
MSEKSGPDMFDPWKPWREWFIQNERAWSEEITKVMKHDMVAETVGKEINTGLLRQQMLTEGMSASLSFLNLPTKEDLVALGERIGRLEDSIARQEAVLTQLKSIALGDSSGVPRTRKYPEGGTSTSGVDEQ